MSWENAGKTSDGARTGRPVGPSSVQLHEVRAGGLEVVEMPAAPSAPPTKNPGRFSHAPAWMSATEVVESETCAPGRPVEPGTGHDGLRRASARRRTVAP